MQNFRYSIAGRVRDASSTAKNVHVIAGGTELLNWLRLGIVSAERIIDIGKIDGLADIKVEGNGLRVGALATLADIGAHPLVLERMPVLAKACLAAASPQIRNRATIGGNVLQKTRCEYFRSAAPLSWPCNKRSPGSGCAAHEGINQRHAIFGWTKECVATQPSDPLVALAALDALVEIQGPLGRRHLPVDMLHFTQEEAAKAGHAPAGTETRLQPGEIITSYMIPSGQRSAYVKVRERASYEYALVSAAAVISVDGGRIVSSRVFLGSVAQKPWPVDAVLKGLAPRREDIFPAITKALTDARPLKGNGYKVRMAAGAATRAILEAAA